MRRRRRRACVYGGSACVCLSVHREVCVYLPFLHSHTPPPLSCDRINDEEEVLQGGGRCGRKGLLRMPCAYVCVPEERQNEFFPTSETSSPSRSGARCVLFSSGEQRKAKELFFVCVTCPCFISLLTSL